MTALPILTPRKRARVLLALGITKAPGIKPYAPPKPIKKPALKKRPAAPIPKAIRCITTGEVFPSITAAAYAHHVYPSHLSAHLKGRGKSVGGRVYERTQLDAAPTKRHSTNPRAVRCIDDGQEFPSITACANHYGIAPANLKHHLDGMYKGLNNRRFEWM